MTNSIEQRLAAIARQTLGIATLQTRHADALDFHTLAVWQIADALRQAFAAGRETCEDRRRT
jgi:hypothetical protein